jgi:hypothetical protein
MSIVAIALCGLLVSGSALAKGDYSRPGPYVGVGIGVAWDPLEELINDAFPVLSIDPTWTINARAGYRVWSWLAVEGMYEGAYGFDVVLTTVGNAASFSTTSLLGNLKLVLPCWRIQPYLLVGVGAQYGKWDDVLNLLDDQRWDLVVRPAVGTDIYVNDSWVLFAELGIPVRFRDWTNIPSAITDNVSITLSGGLQYRF